MPSDPPLVDRAPAGDGVRVRRARPGGDPWPSWRVATDRALYADDGFYRHTGQPARHFRTSVPADPFVGAVLALLGEVDAALGRPGRLDVVDVGAGGGELLAGLARLAPAVVDDRLRLTAVELAPRPLGLPDRIRWTATVPGSITGLVVANEWLDNVPVDVVELGIDGPRLLLVDPRTGAERSDGPPDPREREWLDRWWPLTERGARAEIGLPRDRAWAGVVRSVRRGVVVAADYAHHRRDRPTLGTLTGYRDGRQVPPVPDGSCDVTAHVAMDACAEAGIRAGAGETLLTTQRVALRSLGLHGRRPPLDLANTDPRGYLRELARAGAEAELVDAAGLGAFCWLVQAVCTCLPTTLRATMKR